jgi:hypothetical protein
MRRSWPEHPVKGEALALGVVGALAVAGVVSRRGSRARRWAYHLTYQSDLPSIAAKGLVPQRDTETAWGNEPGVYFVNVFGHEAGPGADPETTAWLRFPWPEDVPDGGRGMDEYRTLRKIPAATIEVFVSDGGFPTYEEGGRWRPLAKRGSAVRRPAWITPAFLRALRETEQTCIRDEGHTLVCREAVWAILERFPELGLWNEYRETGLHHDIRRPEGVPDWRQLPDFSGKDAFVEPEGWRAKFARQMAAVEPEWWT